MRLIDRGRLSVRTESISLLPSFARMLFVDLAILRVEILPIIGGYNGG
jgi:hypothetical protein